MKNYYILRLKARKTEKTERKKERKFNPQSQYNHIFDCLLVRHLSNIRRSLVPFPTVSPLANVDCVQWPIQTFR